MYFSSTTTEVLISEVEIIWMLMRSSASVAEHLGGDAGVGAHADAHERDLGDLVVAHDARARRSRASPSFSRMSIARLNSFRCTVNEKSVSPSMEAFWMIMSTSMFASAIGPEDREGDAGAVGDADAR